MKILILKAVGPPERYVVTKRSKTTGERGNVELKGGDVVDGSLPEKAANEVAAAHRATDKENHYIVSPKLYVQGQIITVDDELAERYIAAGIAADTNTISPDVLKTAEARFKGVMKSAPEDED